MNKKKIIIIACVLFALILFGGILGSSDDEKENEIQLSGTEAEINNNAESDSNRPSVSVLYETEENATKKYSFKSTTGQNTTSKKHKTTQKKTSSGAGIKDVSSDNIPAYNGRPYVVVNNNNPSFTSAEKKLKKSFEQYSKLDSRKRCGVAFALIGKDIMPTGKRGEIGQIKPSGWQTSKYDFVDGRYLYNRCHLIGWQLTGENANERNLITGTRYMNVDGMLPFENMVDDYIEETNNHVLYRVTPIFKGNELVCRGVQIEAYSVEDNGDGICFNVYCFNVQPGVKIDYKTGLNSLSGEEIVSTATTKKHTTKTPSTTKTTTAKRTTTTTISNSNTKYILNINSDKFHYPDCKSVKKMNKENKRETNESRDMLISRGYKPCENCDP